MGNRSGISLEGAVSPVIGAPAFTSRMNHARLIDFREGEIAGTHAAEGRDLDTPMGEILAEAADSVDTYPVSDEFTLGAALRAYQVREARRGE